MTRIDTLKPGEIFVFGSNSAGAHGGGAARFAYERFGAVWGHSEGLQGQSYGIDTMSALLRWPQLRFRPAQRSCGGAGW